MAKQAIFEKKNILVTGGAGFIGSHLCDELVKTAKVICIDNFATSQPSNIEHLLQNPDFIFINHDINESLDLMQFPELERFRVEFQGVQEIYDLACPTSPKNFEEHRIRTLESNTLGVRNALECARKYNAKYLFASSSVVYGARQEHDPYFFETHVGALDQASPRACYDLGKKFAESMVNTYHAAYNLRIRIARIFRTYGPRMLLKNGHMIPDFIVQALQNEDLVVFGDETFQTSLCYVSDVVDGLLRLMATSRESLTVNLGSDQDVPILTVAEKVLKLTNSQAQIRFEAPLLFLTPLGLPVISQAKDELGWIPVVTLERGLSMTVDYTKAERARIGW